MLAGGLSGMNNSDVVMRGLDECRPEDQAAANSGSFKLLGSHFE